VTPRRSHRWILGILIIFLVAAILFAPSYGWKLRDLVSPRENAVAGQTGPNADDPNLVAENDALKAQLATYQTISAELPNDNSHYIRAMVYSRYPFNFKNQILVSAGAQDGVSSGTAVLFQGMLLGRIIQIFPHEAIVQTVLDSGFEMPVRVSSSGYDGLFMGGASPKVGSIAKTAALQTGDVVYAAASGLPYGLPLGTVTATSTSADSLFTEAAIGFPYDMNAVQTVLIAQTP